MKAVVFGGSGLIGSKVVAALKAQGHEAVVAARNLGIDVVTGEGLDAVLQNADIVIDTTDAPSFEDNVARSFFETATGNIIAAAKNQGIKHYIALSVVGTHKLQNSGYFQGKLKQESLIQASGIPYTIARATQFYEFVLLIAQAATADNVVRLPSAKLQPLAAIDVATAIAELASGTPYNGIVDIAGPEKIALSEFARKALVAQKDTREVVTDESALYVQTFKIDDSTLTPEYHTLLGNTGFDAWLADPAKTFK
ncbi:MAG: SDR family oxidoreductase [Methylophilus sp.]|uniref:SDR family oxidoreductase n=1 Tax=Methylophilus sp. TaxID=29541 RepID=UPI003FA1959C